MSSSLFSANSRSPTKSRSAYMVHYNCFDQVFTTVMMSFYVKIIPLVCDGRFLILFSPSKKQQFCPQKSPFHWLFDSKKEKSLMASITFQKKILKSSIKRWWNDFFGNIIFPMFPNQILKLTSTINQMIFQFS